MSDLPWRTDISISDDALLACVREQWPDCPPDVALHPLGDGWDCRSLLVSGGGSRWVLRVPKRFAVVSSVEREVRLLEELAPNLPVMVPRPLFRFEPAGEIPAPFWLVDLAPGKPLNKIIADNSPLDHARLAESVGSFLRTLHGLTPASADAPPEEGMEHEPQRWKPELREALDRGEHDLGPDAAGKLFDWVRNLPRRLPFERARVAHADLFPEHAFLDEQTSTLIAVIDWADCTWDDPAVDFVGFALPLGEAWLRTCMESYGAGAIDDALVSRVRLLSILVGLYDLAKGYRGAPNIDPAQRARALRERVAEGWAG